jgi:hypothetical protein
MNKTILLMLLCAGSLIAQANPDQSQQPVKAKKGEVTMQGCVARSSGDYILTQTDPAISYVLQGSKNIKLRHYLGQQVEVTGTKLPSMSTSSDFLARTGSPAPETISIDTIKTISKRCGI